MSSSFANDRHLIQINLKDESELIGSYNRKLGNSGVELSSHTHKLSFLSNLGSDFLSVTPFTGRVSL